jgi:hypothetical protein
MIEAMKSEEKSGMTALAFQQVDVFTALPFKGNPVAVILDGDALSSEQMQSIAAWTNLSETTFVCTPTDRRADYHLRKFTPRRELPFAGHPTIGSAHAVLRRGFKPPTAGRLVQECSKGLVDIKIMATSVCSSPFPNRSFANRSSYMSPRSPTVWASRWRMCCSQRSSMSDLYGLPFNSPVATPSEPSRLTWASSPR